MTKHDNKLALSVLATLTAGIALIYTLIKYNNIIFAVAGVSLLFLITAYILTQNIIAFVTMQNKSFNVHMKDCINDISSQIENMNGAQSQITKANFLYTRRIAQAVATLENNYIESQEALYRNLTTLSSVQNKATKLMIKCDQSNTTKVISTLKDLRNQLSDTMIQGFDQIQPNNTEMVSMLEDIVNQLKSQPTEIDQTMCSQLNNVASELQNIANNIQQIQISAQNMAQATTYNNTASQPANPISDITTASDYIESSFSGEMDIPKETEDVSEATLESQLTIEPESISEGISDTVAEPELISEEISDTVTEPEAIPEEFPDTPDEAEPIIDESTIEQSSDAEETFSPTFTVVGKEPIEEEPETIDNIPTIADLGNDPNKQLSADEIAALFAATDPAPKRSQKEVEDKEPEPVKMESTSDNPNKQLSADEIAALFTAAEPAPKKDVVALEEQKMDAALEQAMPTVEPISDNPNKQLSPDEIAALFSSMG